MAANPGKQGVVAAGSEEPDFDPGTPQSSQVARRGLRSGDDIARFSEALLADVLDGSITAQQANAAAMALGGLIRVVELQYRHGKSAVDPLLPGRSAARLPASTVAEEDDRVLAQDCPRCRKARLHTTRSGDVWCPECGWTQ